MPGRTDRQISGSGPDVRFDFGVNWLSYSHAVLNEERLAAAENSLRELLEAQDLKGMAVLDAGCGSGLFSIAAARLGAARVTGIDISAASIEASELNAGRFLPNSEGIRFLQQDVLAGPISGEYDLVYAWGSLHHTGALWKAIGNTAMAVRPGGILAIAIYNRHWSSPAWRVIKRFYNRGSSRARRVLLWSCWLPIFFAKTIVSGEWTLRMRRGMDFKHDVIDWVGGYPYEYASEDEVIEFLTSHGFTLVRRKSTKYGAGNNEFVFRRASLPAPGGADSINANRSLRK